MNELELFLESCRSQETKRHYQIFLQKFLDFPGVTKSPKDIENKIIQFILHLKREGKSYSAIKNYLSPVKSYYQIQDIALNVKKINRFFPAQKKTKSDRPYMHQEISQLLENSDERVRVVILLMASSGCRIGAIPNIRLRNLHDRKVTIYENDREEYFTFITPECKKAIDSYLNMRSRHHESLNGDSYLIREQFDVRCPRKPKKIRKESIQYKLFDLCKRCGIDKKNIAVAHGFRKFFTTQLIKAKVNPEIREMLLGHKIGLASSYYRPTEDEMLAEYERAIDNLTINEENKLRKKVEVLTIEASKVDLALSELEKVKKEIRLTRLGLKKH